MTEQTAVVARQATYEDVLDAPEHMVAEIIGGALHLHPRPRSRHARVSSALGRQIGGPFDYDPGGPGGWWILDEPELHLGPDVLVPDLAGWRRERMPVLEDVPYFEMAPDWVCEVLSPATRARDRGTKRDLYGGHGVSHLWLVDPEDRQVEAFERRDEAWVLRLTAGGEDRVALPPFEAAELDLAPLWLPPAPDEAAPDER